jgi:hypothetical protein
VASEKSTQSNCEADGNSNLLSFASVKVSQLPDSVLCFEDFATAFSKPLSEAEEIGLEYCSGYFFGKLLKYHKTACTTCAVNGSKVTSSTVAFKQNEIFLYFKRFQTDSATLANVLRTLFH